MAIYAFDGTGNEDKDEDDKDTNVRNFFDAYRPTGDENFYVAGVGTRFGLLGKFFGLIFGAGGQRRIRKGIKALEANFRAGDRVIDIIGFSRGAAMALDFANKICDEGVSGDQAPEIRFLGLWDTVASFGVPGNQTDLGYKLTVPKNVKICRHSMSLDERRFTFPLTRLTQDKLSGTPVSDVQEVWFRGYHSDVGGGNENEGLSNISLYWMYRRAQDAGLELDSNLLSESKGRRDPGTEPKKPGMDLSANEMREIRETDKVHDSVTELDQADGFSANNPHDDLAVVGDDGDDTLRTFRGSLA